MFGSKNIKRFIILYVLIFCGAFIYHHAIDTYASVNLPKISAEDKKYLEDTAYGVNFPSNCEMTKAKLKKGKDVGIYIQFKGESDFSTYVNQVSNKLLSTTNYIEGYETIDGYTVSAETLCGKAMNNTIYFRAYSMNGRYYLEMYSNVVNKQIEEIFS